MHIFEKCTTSISSRNLTARYRGLEMRRAARAAAGSAVCRPVCLCARSERACMPPSRLPRPTHGRGHPHSGAPAALRLIPRNRISCTKRTEPQKGKGMGYQRIFLWKINSLQKFPLFLGIGFEKHKWHCYRILQRIMVFLSWEDGS